MNAEKHIRAFSDQIIHTAQGKASDHDKHNKFYDEYLAVMDMTAEFYLSTVERLFKNREIAQNKFVFKGTPVDFADITDVPIKIVEGGQDDISAPGQCAAALALCSGLADSKKQSMLNRTLVIMVFLPEAVGETIFARWSWILLTQIASLPCYWDITAPAPSYKIVVSWLKNNRLTAQHHKKNVSRLETIMTVIWFTERSLAFRPYKTRFFKPMQQFKQTRIRKLVYILYVCPIFWNRIPCSKQRKAYILEQEARKT